MVMRMMTMIGFDDISPDEPCSLTNWEKKMN